MSPSASTVGSNVGTVPKRSPMMASMVNLGDGQFLRRDDAERFVNSTHVTMQTHLAHAEAQRLKEHKLLSLHLIEERKDIALARDAEIIRLSDLLAARGREVAERDEELGRCRAQVASLSLEGQQRARESSAAAQLGAQAAEMARLDDLLASRSRDLKGRDEEIRRYRAEVWREIGANLEERDANTAATSTRPDSSPRPSPKPHPSLTT